LIATIILVAVIVCSGIRRFWNWKLAIIWTVGLTAVAVLMWGGVLGLTYVENARWGGLPLTLILSTFGIAFAFPIGVLLALGRRSKMPAIKALCVVYIELIRGVPLISLLFMSSVMLPLFLPEGFSIDKLLRAQIAIIMFAAAYIAETVRGGLQAIPKGQYEGADSLGLSYWQQMRKIILPQALKIVIPPLVSIFIALFKDTSLVVIIGIFDLTLAAKAALSDAAWRGFGVEAYLFISLIYFVFCFSMSKYSQALEKRLATGHARTAILTGVQACLMPSFECRT
jgi:general L-amino acid transport system permease protein